MVGVTMTAVDLRDPSAFLGRLRRAYARARSQNLPRRWATGYPASWVRTDTVERRRALTPDQQEHLLGYRRAS